MAYELTGKIKLGPAVLVLPLYHIMARGFLLAAGLNQGNTTVLMPGFHGDALMKEIERHQVSWLLVAAH